MFASVGLVWCEVVLRLYYSYAFRVVLVVWLFLFVILFIWCRLNSLWFDFVWFVFSCLC